jgi:tetratricopeptide (TPR) repeat protein
VPAKRIASFLICLTALAALPLAAQNAPQPNHVHYPSAPAAAAKPAPSGALAPRLQNLGTHKVAWFTCTLAARPWLNQGINLAYGFNHAEAERAFREAARLDANCAMAYWGQAWVIGPNINAPMAPEDEPRARALVQKAQSLRTRATLREQDYIAALATRYTGESADRKKADAAFADAMRALAKKYPADLEAQTIFAEALMDLRPWDYWSRDGIPYPGTQEMVDRLDFVMRRNPRHPGALHYWIHAVEATKNPERAEKAADTLLRLMPAAGHMVHMPAHIFFRVGRYADAAESNRLAILADEDYISQCKAQGIYPLAYYSHNIHFLWAAATNEGRSAVAIESARKTAGNIPAEALKAVPFLQVFLVPPYQALVRFGKWDEILREPAPQHQTPFTMGFWHFARSSAFRATDKLDEAEKELERLRERYKEASAQPGAASFSVNTDDRVLRVAVEVAAGELAARRGRFAEAVNHLATGVRFEDALVYTEPADWNSPVRQNLGAVLLAAGRPSEAESVYWEDLRYNPENPWSLYGLMQALRAQGNNDAAAHVEKRFHKAWVKADTQINASRF